MGHTLSLNFICVGGWEDGLHDLFHVVLFSWGVTCLNSDIVSVPCLRWALLVQLHCKKFVLQINIVGIY